MKPASSPTGTTRQAPGIELGSGRVSLIGLKRTLSRLLSLAEGGG